MEVHEPLAKAETEPVVPVMPPVAVLASSEVPSERHLALAQEVNSFLCAYESQEQQTLAITRFSMPLGHILKQPD